MIFGSRLQCYDRPVRVNFWKSKLCEASRWFCKYHNVVPKLGFIVQRIYWSNLWIKITESGGRTLPWAWYPPFAHSVSMFMLWCSVLKNLPVVDNWSAIVWLLPLQHLVKFPLFSLFFSSRNVEKKILPLRLYKPSTCSHAYIFSGHKLFVCSAFSLVWITIFMLITQ